MTYWIVAIVLLNLYVLVFTTAPSFVKLNAAMVTIIALVAFIRIWQKKRQRAVEHLLDDLQSLQKENEDLKNLMQQTEKS